MSRRKIIEDVLLANRGMPAAHVAGQICAALDYAEDNRVGLTAKQRELYEFIEAYIARHGIAPSYDEMTAACGLASKSGINRLLRGLEARGWVKRHPAIARGIRIERQHMRSAVNEH